MCSEESVRFCGKIAVSAVTVPGVLIHNASVMSELVRMDFTVTSELPQCPFICSEYLSLSHRSVQMATQNPSQFLSRMDPSQCSLGMSQSQSGPCKNREAGATRSRTR